MTMADRRTRNGAKPAISRLRLISRAEVARSDDDDPTSVMIRPGDDDLTAVAGQGDDDPTSVVHRPFHWSRPPRVRQGGGVARISLRRRAAASLRRWRALAAPLALCAGALVLIVGIVAAWGLRARPANGTPAAAAPRQASRSTPFVVSLAPGARPMASRASAGAGGLPTRPLARTAQPRLDAVRGR